MSISQKIEDLITASNAVTGESRTDLTSCIQDLKDGYGGGGGGGNTGDAYVYPYVNGALNGKVKLYQAGKSLRSLQGVMPSSSSSNPPAYTVPTFQDNQGNSISSVGYGIKSYNSSQAQSSGKDSLKLVSPFLDLTPYISTEAEQDFNTNDYAINGLTDYSVSNSATQAVGGVTLTISYTPPADMIVKSFKFYKTFMLYGKGDKTVLYMAVYLDNPLSLTAGIAETIALELSAYEH